MADCDVDGILCELETLQHLKALEKLQGKEVMIAKFPEFDSLQAKLTDEIKSHKDTLREALEKCGQFSGEEELEATIEGFESE